MTLFLLTMRDFKAGNTSGNTKVLKEQLGSVIWGYKAKLLVHARKQVF